MLTKTLGSLQNPRATAGALGALRAFCRDPPNISKMVWAGGVTAMLNVLDKGEERGRGSLALLCRLGFA